MTCMYIYDNIAFWIWIRIWHWDNRIQWQKRTKCIDRSLNSTKNWSFDNTGPSIMYRPFAIFLGFYIYFMCMRSRWHAPNTPTPVTISGKIFNFKILYKLHEVPKVNTYPYVKFITFIYNNFTIQLSIIFVILKWSFSYRVIIVSVPIGLWLLIMCVSIYFECCNMSF